MLIIWLLCNGDVGCDFHNDYYGVDYDATVMLVMMILVIMAVSEEIPGIHVRVL